MSKIKSFIHQVLLLLLWKCLKLFVSATKPQSRAAGLRRAVFVPADPITFVGSRGDAAMMEAVLSIFRPNYPDAELYVASTNSSADEIAASMELKTVRVWGGPLMPIKFYRQLKEIRPDVGIVNGADIMDGYYSPVMSLRMVIAADLFALSGAKSIFTGFSFNANPAILVRLAFWMLDPAVKVNLRDPVSFDRFSELTGCAANLVSDSAFLLKPAQNLEKGASEAVDWVGVQHSLGRTVVVLNVHPMLFNDDVTESSMGELLESLCSSVSMLDDSSSISWLLLPHDDREKSGDIRTLAEISRILSMKLGERVHFVEAPPSAAEIKTIMAYVDGVVTGRMHLAIAALGQGKPVMAFAYQDKFAGLLQHFAMPNWLILDANDAKDPSFLSASLNRFVKELPSLKADVEKHLPRVILAAESTFAEIA